MIILCKLINYMSLFNLKFIVETYVCIPIFDNYFNQKLRGRSDINKCKNIFFLTVVIYTSKEFR